MAETDAVYYENLRDGEGRKANTEFTADAELYKAKRKAEADYEAARLQAEARKLQADAEFYTKKQSAAGLIEMANAYGAMSNVLGGPAGLIQWMMLERGTYENLARQNACAIQGLQPKINVWNTGSNAESADSMAPIRNLFQSLPPLLSTIQDQTGMMPPSWLAQMPQQGQEKIMPTLASKSEGRMNGVKG